MWAENQTWWKKILFLANQREIPLIFKISDPMGSRASRFLEKRLEELASGYENIYVFRLGPKSFGIESEEPDQIRREVKSNLLLKRDPHGNSLEHGLTASAVYQFCSERKLAKQLMGSKKIEPVELSKKIDNPR